MKIGIIGSGNIGATPTRRPRGLGHDVTVANWRQEPGTSVYEADGVLAGLSSAPAGTKPAGTKPAGDKPARTTTSR